MKKILYMWMALMPCLLGACSENDEVNSELKTAVTKTGSLETVEITLETAGTLAEKLGDKAATTEKLILSGPVDADDVTTFRGMKNLVSLDIKGVEFVESDKKYERDYFVKKETISESMFRSLKLTQLILPENIRAIGNWAFYHLPIKTIDLPSKVERIGDSAFMGCNSLERIVVPDGVSAIEHQTFGECYALQSVTLPQKLESIGEYAFSGCRSLTAIDIPETVLELKESAFSGTGLKSITIPEKVKAIPQTCFYRCGALEIVVLPSELTTIGQGAFASCSLLTTIDIPETLRELKQSAFSESGLKSIAIPENVKVIPEACFNKCNDLETVMLPSVLTTIERRAFSDCSLLTTIDIPETVVELDYRAFFKSGLKSITIPENVKVIPQSCFDGCKDLETVVFPSGLTTIRQAAFYDCSLLTTINIPATVTEIGHNCFGNCASLKEVRLPDNLLYIRNGAFCNCQQLKVMDIPQKAQLIEAAAFQNSGLEALFVKGKTKLEDLFYNEHSNCLIYLSDPDSEVSLKLHNLIYNGVASSLTLTGDDTGSTFFCHQSFKAQKITFTKAFNLDYFGAFPSSGQPAGWAAISLPFSVDKITAADGRVLAPFRAEVADAKPFWLRKLTSNGFENVTRMEAGESYIIAMPYDERYDAEYNVRGTVTFTAQDFTNGILIPETTYRTASGPEYDFNANYEILPKSASYYVLNTYDDVKGYKQGGVFVRSLRATYPFEPYVTNKSGVANVSKVFGIGPSVQTRAKHTVGSKPSIDDK